MLIIFIPATYYIFYLTKMLTSALDSVGFSSSGLNFILYVISMFTIVFSFNVVLNTMYNSKDIEYLRSLPFKQEQISLAKLLYLTFTESMIQFMFIIGAFIGFFYIIGFDVFRVIIMIIGLLTIPIIPVCYCAIICLIARALSSTIKINKILIKVIKYIFIIGVIFCFIYFINDNNIEEVLSMENSSFKMLMNIIFPQIELLTSSIEYPIKMLWYILINLAVIIVFYYLSKVLYFKGFNETFKKKKISKYTIKKTKLSKSYIKKEFLLLFKTPAYLFNCILSNMLLPGILLLIIFLFNAIGYLDLFINKLQDDSLRENAILIGFMIGGSMILTSTNSIASSAISREGEAFKMIKILPINYKKQLHLKALVSIIITYIILPIFILAFGIYARLGFRIIYYLVISLLMVIFASYFGLYIDTINPKLVWDSEMNALRGNHSVFIAMGMTIVIAGIILFFNYLLYLAQIKVILLMIIDLLIIVLNTIFMLFYFNKKASKNIIRIEI